MLVHRIAMTFITSYFKSCSSDQTPNSETPNPDLFFAKNEFVYSSRDGNSLFDNNKHLHPFFSTYLLCNQKKIHCEQTANFKK